MFRRLPLIFSLAVLATIGAIQPAEAYTETTWEHTVAVHVNHYDRLPRGIPAVRTNLNLSSIAHAHSAAMARAQVLKHSTNLGSLVRGWTTLGENVGVGMSLSDINRAFMASRSHRDNILCRCYRQFGTGVVRDTRGRYWVTQVFFG